MESAEQIRRATINDIGGILELIRPLEQQGILCAVLASSWRWKSTNSPLFSAITRLLPAPRSIRSRKRRLGKWPVWQFTRITAVHLAGGAFRERFASRDLKLQFSLPDSITVFGDRDRLMQLFNNLLENSLRYTDSGGSLQISAGQRDKTVRLTFADSAPGVSDDQLQKLFERFYRTEGSRNRASGGSGLGLAICLNIVEAHNGRIIAAHSPFGGVSITVELPLERDLQREV